MESQTLTIRQERYDAESSPSAVTCPGDLEAKVGVATLTVNEVSDGVNWDIKVAAITPVQMVELALPPKTHAT